MKRKHRSTALCTIWAPIALALMLYPFSYNIDLFFSSLAFDQSRLAFSPPTWCSWIYIWGLLPGQLLFIAAAAITLFGLFSRSVRARWLWKSSLYLFLTLAIGSGLIAHGICKEQFTRPRPKQIHEFGGKYRYIPPFGSYNSAQIALREKLRSMPSGHATMGFYFCSLWFLGQRTGRRALSWGGLIFGIILGTLLSISRVLEGGHFISDGIVAALIMWYTALALDSLILRRP